MLCLNRVQGSRLIMIIDMEQKHFTQFGGGTFGKKVIIWPFAKLTAFPHGITITCLGQEYLFEKGQILELIDFKGRTKIHGLLIKHNIPIYPEHIVFWTLDIRRLKKYFYLLGFTVHE